MVTEDLTNAALALWHHHLEKYEPVIIREAALKSLEQFNFPPTPKQFMEIADAMVRNKRMNDDMVVRDKSRLLEATQPKTLSRETLEAKREMWVKLGMMNKVKGIDDELTALDLQEK